MSHKNFRIQRIYQQPQIQFPTCQLHKSHNKLNDRIYYILPTILYYIGKIILLYEKFFFRSSNLTRKYWVEKCCQITWKKSKISLVIIQRNFKIFLKNSWVIYWIAYSQMWNNENLIFMRLLDVIGFDGWFLVDFTFDPPNESITFYDMSDFYSKLIDCLWLGI